ncbi:hypothetical protein EGW08_004266 [Elysia chlorotica]|uniref:Uncharacterized protein n=1 Tax=Elysia chlorotica TaxID=188477 RepID=A0A433U2K8_ELYCH|nr:hypothetical protein EGW08_004266 [Elysia chlorotica]
MVQFSPAEESDCQTPGLTSKPNLNKSDSREAIQKTNQSGSLVRFSRRQRLPEYQGPLSANANIQAKPKQIRFKGGYSENKPKWFSGEILQTSAAARVPRATERPCHLILLLAVLSTNAVCLCAASRSPSRFRRACLGGTQPAFISSAGDQVGATEALHCPRSRLLGLKERRVWRWDVRAKYWDPDCGRRSRSVAWDPSPAQGRRSTVPGAAGHCRVAMPGVARHPDQPVSATQRPLGGRQPNSGVCMADSKSTLGYLWRPPETLYLRQSDSDFFLLSQVDSE